MRYGPEHKETIHQKIVEDAARRVRAEGMNGTAVASVMKDAGLTHGGFYKHFHSKDQLLLESLHAAFGEIVDRLVRAGEKARPGTAWKAIVKEYLSPELCADVARGCPLAALAPELARAEGAMRGRIVQELLHYRDRVVPYMPGRRRVDRERNFLLIMSTMIGTLAIARILPDGAGRARVLRNAQKVLLASF